MTENLKQRIDKINRGEVPEGYKKTKVGIVPSEWEVKKFKKVAIPIKEKVGDRQLETLSISAGKGFVNQAEKFGKELSGKQYVNYTVIGLGDFSYNKGNSKRYPQGCVYMLQDRHIAAVPNVFNSFRIRNHQSHYFRHLFESGFLNKQLYRIINAGVRNDGLLNLYDDDFYNCTLSLPPLPEQEKIAEILTTCDKVIELKEKLIEQKQAQKKWLMQNLLTGKKRLDGFTGEWKKVKLGEVGTIVTGTTPPTINHSFYNGEYPWITPTDMGEFKNICASERKLTKLGLEKGRFIPADSLLVTCIASIGKNAILKVDGSCNQQINAITPNSKFNVEYLYYLICKNVYILKVNAGTSATQILNKETFSNLKFHIPPLPEQTAIANILSTADKEIELLQSDLAQWQNKKKALMQLLLTGKVRV